MKALALLLLLFATDGFAQAQNLAGKQETRSYSSGVGRITWSFPDALPAIFAVPHWTAGPRVLCGDERLRCEVQVGPRDISISREARNHQLGEAARSRLPLATKQALQLRPYGGPLGTVYIVVDSPQQGGGFHYLAMGYAHKGPAVLKFEVSTDDPADVRRVLQLVEGARAIDALRMWALRLGDYRAVCEERFPAYKGANDRAFAGSPFAAVDLVHEFLNDEPGATEEGARKRLSEVRNGFAAEFDRDPAERRRAFCEGFPNWVAEAAKGL